MSARNLMRLIKAYARRSHEAKLKDPSKPGKAQADPESAEGTDRRSLRGRNSSSELTGNATKSLESLEERFQRLNRALERDKEASTNWQASGSKRDRAWGRSIRFATDFMAGIAVGGLLGAGFDWLASTLPWGLFVGVLLGFAAGTLNILRADKEVQRTILVEQEEENKSASGQGKS